jgi:hypothetical protein
MEPELEQERWQNAIGELMSITPPEPRLSRNPVDAVRIIEEGALLPQKNPYKLLFDIMRHDRKKSSLVRALKKLKTFQKENSVDPTFSEYAATTLEWIAQRSKLNGFENFGLKALKIMKKLEFENKENRMNAIVEEYKRRGIEVDVKKLDKKWKAKKKAPKEAKTKAVEIVARRGI